ncbi:MAG: ATP-binding protein [Thermoleophilia bacterium]
MERAEKRSRWTSLLIVGLTILLLAGLGAVGSRLYYLQRDALVEHRLGELQALGASQSAQMDEWLAERAADAAVVAIAPAMADYFVAKTAAALPPVGITGLIDRIASTFDYQAAMLVDPKGVILLIRPSINAEFSEGAVLPAAVADALGEAWRTGIGAVAVSTEIERDLGAGGRLHPVYLAAPVSGAHGEFVGGVVFMADPARAALPRVLGLKRVGSGENPAVESMVVHESAGHSMVVARDPPGFEGAMLDEDEAPVLGVVSRASQGISGLARERDRAGRMWLAAGLWSPKLGLGFVNRQPEDLVIAGTRRTALLGSAIAGLLIVFLAALALAVWRGSRLKAVAVLREIEGEKAELEKRVAVGERLELIGRLAGGVAHDFNNLLAVVIGHLELADGSTLPDDAREDLRVARDAAVRAARIGRQLLGVGRHQVLEREPLDLRPHVARAAQTLRGVAPSGVRIEVEAPAGLADVHADAVEIERVILNLVMNAVEAVGDTGSIVLSAMDRTVSARIIAVNGQIEPGRYVVLSVRDDGPGIAAESRERVFEPFFTTKRDGAGGGLGLASTLGVVSQHGGFLTLMSEPGTGAVFEVYLPALDGPPALLEPGGSGRAEAAPPADPNTSATILVVDDEPGVRAFVQRALRAHGYQVVSAASSAEAEAAWRSCPVDLLVSDVIMPGGTGIELLDSLRRLQPSLRAVLMSGYTAGAVLERDERLSDTRFLAKPFSGDELVAEVGRALEGLQQ